MPTLALFDAAAGELPPRDAIEVYVETPTTVGIYYDTLASSAAAARLPGAQAEHERAAILAAREAGVEAFLASIREHASYLRIGFHRPKRRGSRDTYGRFEQGHLYVTRVAHQYVHAFPSREVEDASDTRFHDHIYIGRYGRYPHHERGGIDADARPQAWDDPNWPVDSGTSFTESLHIAGVLQEAALEESLTASLGVRWEVPDDQRRRDRPRELVDPPFDMFLGEVPRTICPGLPRSECWQGPSPAHRLEWTLAHQDFLDEELEAALRLEAEVEELRARDDRRRFVRDILYPPLREPWPST